MNQENEENKQGVETNKMMACISQFPCTKTPRIAEMLPPPSILFESTDNS